MSDIALYSKLIDSGSEDHSWFKELFNNKQFGAVVWYLAKSKPFLDKLMQDPDGGNRLLQVIYETAIENEEFLEADAVSHWSEIICSERAYVSKDEKTYQIFSQYKKEWKDKNFSKLHEFSMRALDKLLRSDEADWKMEEISSIFAYFNTYLATYDHMDFERLELFLQFLAENLFKLKDEIIKNKSSKYLVLWNIATNRQKRENDITEYLKSKNPENIYSILRKRMGLNNINSISNKVVNYLRSI
jgi:hypothetical protein